MKKKRRKQINGIIYALKLCSESIQDVCNDELVYYNKIPVTMGGSEEGDRSIESVESMEASLININDTIDNLKQSKK